MKFSKRYRFANWPNPDIPNVAAGVYAIWKEDLLFYCGMSGRNIEGARDKPRFGLITRLNSHASGRLSGDQFCVYVANRLVLPDLGVDDLPRFSNGDLSLDTLTKQYIHDHLDYQYVLVDSSREAYDLERKARSGEVFGQKPLLNPT